MCHANETELQNKNVLYILNLEMTRVNKKKAYSRERHPRIWNDIEEPA